MGRSVCINYIVHPKSGFMISHIRFCFVFIDLFIYLFWPCLQEIIIFVFCTFCHLVALSRYQGFSFFIYPLILTISLSCVIYPLEKSCERVLNSAKHLESLKELLYLDTSKPVLFYDKFPSYIIWAFPSFLIEAKDLLSGLRNLFSALLILAK